MREPSAPEHPALDAESILGILNDHHVAYVVVGGYAAELHGSARPTVDVDVVPATDADNLSRLAAALRDLGARIRTDSDPEGLPFSTSAEALVGMKMLNLLTAHGELDLTFTPSGTTGYDDLVRDASDHRVGAVTVAVASLDDVIRSKTAAARLKDLRALPELRALAARDAQH